MRRACVLPRMRLGTGRLCSTTGAALRQAHCLLTVRASVLRMPAAGMLARPSRRRAAWHAWLPAPKLCWEPDAAKQAHLARPPATGTLEPGNMRK